MSKPRVLMVGRTRYRLPLSHGLALKFDALAQELDVHVLGTAARGSSRARGATSPDLIGGRGPTGRQGSKSHVSRSDRGTWPEGPPGRGDAMFTLVEPLRPRLLDGLAFWLALPWRTARLLRAFRPDAVVCQTAYEAAAALLARRLARVPVRVIVEVHGDWRTSTRLYGSPARRSVARIADAVAAAALRRADAVRSVSPFTAELVRALGVEPAADFPAFMDLDPFLGPTAPLPERPAALFVGVLEAYKNIDGLAAAWRRAAAQVPDASLHLVGRGSRSDVAKALAHDLGVRWDPELSAEEVATALDEAWVLVLPSRSEGMGRVLVEAFCRGRGVIGTRAGSIPDLVADEVAGVLVAADDPDALAGALVRVLTDRALAERLGAGAHAAAAPWLQTPEEYARRLRELVA